MTVIIGNGCQLTRTKEFNRNIKMKTEKIINIIGILGVIGSLIFKEYYRLTRSSRLRMVGAEGRT